MKKQLYLMLLFLTVTVSAWAVKVEGVVVDEKKEPVIGATIQVKETKMSAVTDINGKFKINVADADKSTLVVSYVGYKKKSISLDGKTMLTIALEPDQQVLDEVVVVGYGSMKKSDITGSVSSVKAKQEEAMANTSFDKMLQGKAAGVAITTSSSAPGGAINIQIRGTSSLRGDNQPLYVVDGNIIDVDQTDNALASGTGGANTVSAAQNPLSSISPQDIENIEILKDASATAIYGSRGANGVVLITTKQGNSSKPVVTLSSVLTTNVMTKKIDVLSTAEYVDFYNKINPANPLTLSAIHGVDWQDYSTRTAFSQNYRASVSGKNGKTSYYLSTGYMKNQGIVNNTGLKQMDIRLNLTQEINKTFSLQSSTAFSNMNTTMTAGTDKLSSVSSSLITNMILKRPFDGAITASESDADLVGPAAWFKDYDDNSTDNQFSTNLSLTANMTKWLKFQVKEGVVYRNKNRMLWNGPATSTGMKVNGQAGLAGLNSMSSNSQAMFLFNNKFGSSHSLSGTVGVEYQVKSLASSSLVGEDFASYDLRAKGISYANKFSPYVYDESGEQLFSALGRLVYSLKNRYIFTGTFRADGSTKFSDQNKFSYFPSGAFAWRANEESFLKGISALSNLKFRAGWGQVGNQAVKPYLFAQSYAPVYYSDANGYMVTGVIPQRIANPDLKWETSEQYNAGLDLGLFNQRVSFTVDAFRKTTKDLLLEQTIPYASGYATVWKNIGSVENRGLEFTTDFKVIDGKNFKLGLGGNISFLRNKILDLGLSNSDFGAGELKNIEGFMGDNVGNSTYLKFPANVYLVGHSIGQYIGFATDGILKQGETQSFLSNTLASGNYKMKDQNGDGVITEDDRVLLGSPNPDFTYAFNVNMNYKDWSLDMAFNGVQGNEIINANLIDQTNVGNAINNVISDAYYKAYDPAINPNGTYPSIGTKPLGVLTDRLIEDGSYLRLSNVTLSYRLKLPKFAINSLTLSGTVNNVFVLTNYSGYDPDVNSFAGDPDRQGIDLASYPATRGFVFGVTANF